ncbi:MAG TPA: hypothetical protein VFI31_14960 [Pirellulales bacterium]|nr:hypothetical protein [Pirellulales bacterium]
MTISEPGGLASLNDVFLPDHEGADVMVELPGGRRVRFEWSCDAPEIDATVSMDEAANADPLRATSAFDG